MFYISNALFTCSNKEQIPPKILILTLCKQIIFLFLLFIEQEKAPPLQIISILTNCDLCNQEFFKKYNWVKYIERPNASQWASHFGKFKGMSLEVTASCKTFIISPCSLIINIKTIVLTYCHKGNILILTLKHSNQ